MSQINWVQISNVLHSCHCHCYYINKSSYRNEAVESILFHWFARSLWYTQSRNTFTKTGKLWFQRKNFETFCQFFKRKAAICISQWEKNSKRTEYYECPTRNCVRSISFSLNIKRLPTVIEESQVTMFANETSLLKSWTKGELLLQPNGEKLSNWFVSNKSSINVGICETISFGIWVPQEHHLSEKSLTYRESCKYLGLHLDGSLRFRENIDYVVIKLNMFYVLIYGIREQYTRFSLLMFYNSFAKFVIS